MKETHPWLGTKTRKEVLQTVYSSSEVQRMGESQRLMEFETLTRSRVSNRREVCVGSAGDLLHASQKQDCLKDIHACSQSATDLEESNKSVQQTMSHAAAVCEALRQCLGDVQDLGKACEKDRSKAAYAKQQAVASFRKTLKHLVAVQEIWLSYQG